MFGESWSPGPGFCFPSQLWPVLELGLGHLGWSLAGWPPGWPGSLNPASWPGVWTQPAGAMAGLARVTQAVLRLEPELRMEAYGAAKKILNNLAVHGDRSTKTRTVAAVVPSGVAAEGGAAATVSSIQPRRRRIDGCSRAAARSWCSESMN